LNKEPEAAANAAAFFLQKRWKRKQILKRGKKDEIKKESIFICHGPVPGIMYIV
jgi:hypothetical protein